MVKYMLKKVDLKVLKKDKKGNAFLHFKDSHDLLKCKKAVSEMIAYVILISISIGLAVAVYAWLVYFPPIVNEPINCKEGTSISLESYNCTSEGIITLSIKNTGRFNIDGIIAKFGNDSNKEPTEMLIPKYSASLPSAPKPGHFSFTLEPGKIHEAKFKNITSDNTDYNPAGGIVRVVKIQPFIIDDRKKIACIGTTIPEPLLNPICDITP